MQAKAAQKLEKQAKQANKEVLKRKKGGASDAPDGPMTTMIDTTGAHGTSGGSKKREDVLNV